MKEKVNPLDEQIQKLKQRSLRHREGNNVDIRLGRNDLLRLSRQILIEDALIDGFLSTWLNSFESFSEAIRGQLQRLIWYPNEIHFNGSLTALQMSKLCQVLDKHEVNFSARS